MPIERRVVLGLGSNLGDRAGHLAAAVEALAAAPGVRVARMSPVYETPPAGGPAQPDYLNAAALLATSLPAAELLALALCVEASRGRVRPDAVRWGPRTLDVDVLWIEGELHDAPSIVVPHPRLVERPFALVPLLDVAPDATDPATGAEYASLPVARERPRRA